MDTLSVADLPALVLYYSKSIGILLLTTIAIAFFCSRKQSKMVVGPYRVIYHFWLGLPALFWLAMFCATIHQSFLITSLDTEDDLLAEKIYQKYFDLDLDKVIKIATDDQQSGNVRFYASCRIADLLRTNNIDTRKTVLKAVSDATEFKTGFLARTATHAVFSCPIIKKGLIPLLR